MTISRAKQSLFLGLLALTVPVLAGAQDAGRDASFLPVGSSAPAIALPQLAPVASSAPAPVGSALPPPVIITPPVATAPAAVPAVTSAPVVSAPAVVPATATPTSLAPATPSPTPVPAPVVIPPVTATTAKAIEIAKPVETAPIGSVDPQSIGLSGANENSLGATMWKGAARPFVEKLLPSLALPTTSPALNNLARRLMLTTAAAPEGAAAPAGAQSLVAMRVEKLVALGDTENAWKLALLAKPEQLDEITLRLVVEAGLLGPVRNDICAKLPEIVKARSSAEWQKSLLVCQLRANDTKAAQLTLDLLHTQNVNDGIFFYIAEKNIIGGNKQLPRQLTPLKPLTLALLRITDLPLPVEVYVHPDAPLIPELLQSKAREDSARVGLAERAAERGLLNGDALAAIYKSVTFTPDAIAAAGNSGETSPRLHAVLYQAALQEKQLQRRVGDTVKFMQTSSTAFLNGAGSEILAQMIGDVPHTDEANAYSGFIAHVYTLAGKPDKALEWLKQARHAMVGLPPVAAELQSFWPQTVFAGLESDADYAADLSKWLDAFLKNADPKADGHGPRDQAASILLLLDAAGFAVPEEDWAKVLDPPVFEKRLMPSALLFERLRIAASAGHRGESVLIGLAISGGSDTPVLSTVETVRALKQVGLTADAAALAHEAANSILLPPPAK